MTRQAAPSGHNGGHGGGEGFALPCCHFGHPPLQQCQRTHQLFSMGRKAMYPAHSLCHQRQCLALSL